MIQDIPDWTTAIKTAKDVVLGLDIEDPTNFQQVAAILGKATELLLVSKNEKYGKGNMLSALRFGMTIEQGLMLRENDKTERILNHFNGVNLGKEGLLESFGDKAGYAEIGMMLQLKTKDGKSWYELPIKEDAKN
jgi:hypothetical protein